MRSYYRNISCENMMVKIVLPMSDFDRTFRLYDQELLLSYSCLSLDMLPYSVYIWEGACLVRDERSQSWSSINFFHGSML